jgi:hypothetical protein
LIDNVPIEESTINFEEKRLQETNLEIIMDTNGIPPNRCLSKNEQKTIEEAWG